MSSKEATLLRRVTTASVAVAILLILMKLGATLSTNAISMMASLIDSTMDLFASLVTLFAVRIALQPPDEDHRFGHGKAEPLAALAQATFIAGSGVFLFIQAAQRLMNPQPMETADFGILVMLVSMIATAGLLIFQRYVIARTNSPAIKADAAHYGSDFIVNAATIAALWFTQQGAHWVDPLFGAAVGGFILFGAWRVGRTALDQLMDRELLDGTEEKIRQIAHAQPEVQAVGHIRTRMSGRTPTIQLYLYLSDATPLHEAHRIGDEVIEKIQESFPTADILLHEEPISALPRGCAQLI
ncbi:cation diffusion facilitator family transporter [Halothiobacillus sp. DCM-1]|uniref:cation diffusion facilitator family transporter n=1 Tax=Halothiobacillus sp. DCM-1 TaxID=3112558 RepID=UPI00325273BE